MSGAIAPDSEKTAIALVIGFARELDSMTGPCRGNYVDLQSFFPQSGDCRADKFDGTAATGRRIDDSEKAFPHVRTKCLIVPFIRTSQR